MSDAPEDTSLIEEEDSVQQSDVVLVKPTSIATPYHHHHRSETEKQRDDARAKVDLLTCQHKLESSPELLNLTTERDKQKLVQEIRNLEYSSNTWDRFIRLDEGKHKLELAALEQKEEQLQKTLQKEQLKLDDSIYDLEVEAETRPLRKEINVAKLVQEQKLVNHNVTHLDTHLALQSQRDRLKLEEEITDLENTNKRKLQEQITVLRYQQELESLQSNSKKRKLVDDLEIIKMQMELRDLQEDWKNWNDSEPERLTNPVNISSDGKVELVLSDRVIRIPIAITQHSGIYICDRIHYFNNQSKTDPIFLVIDVCCGGSVLAGFQILQTIEESIAPIYVVVKTFTASMGASIATVADNCYVYPNAYMLHHMSFGGMFGNKKQIKDQFEQMNARHKRCEEPIVRAINRRTGGSLTIEEWCDMMYENNCDGDWLMFGDEAVKAGWADKVINRVRETAHTIHPDTARRREKNKDGGNRREFEYENERILPKLLPLDQYRLYDPNNYFKILNE